MLGKTIVASWVAALILIDPAIPFSQDSGEKRTLIINGKSTQVPMIQVNGQSYIGLEALAILSMGH